MSKGICGQVVQAPFISITNVSVDKLSIPKDESAILTAQVSASIGASGGFTLGITENSHSSPAPVYIFGPPTKPGTVTGGGSATSVTFTISNGDGNSGIQKAKLDIYFTVVPTTTPPTVLKNSPTTSQEITFQ